MPEHRPSTRTTSVHSREQPQGPDTAERTKSAWSQTTPPIPRLLSYISPKLPDPPQLTAAIFAPVPAPVNCGAGDHGAAGGGDPVADAITCKPADLCGRHAVAGQINQFVSGEEHHSCSPRLYTTQRTIPFH